MREGIHPTYHNVIMLDVSSGYKFLTGSTKGSNELMEWEDGNSYPVIRVETSSASHPFSQVKCVMWTSAAGLISLIRSMLRKFKNQQLVVIKKQVNP